MARVICLDIETSPNIVYTWGKYDQTAIKRVKNWEILCVAWKVLGEKRAHWLGRISFANPRNERALVKAIWKVIDGADVVVTQNGDRFDLTKLRAKFVAHELPPTRPFKSVDTKKIAKSQFSFYSNSLDDMSEELGTGHKLKHSGFELWEECMKGVVTPGKVNRRAWGEMRRYNLHDVDPLLEQLYLKVRAWHPTHPNLALVDLRGTVRGCPACGSHNTQKRGYAVARVRRQARMHCQKCGHWFTRSLSDAG